MKLAKVLAAVFSAVVLCAGMAWLVAIGGSKFGTVEGGRDGFFLRENLRGLRVATVSYRAAFDETPVAPPCPEGTPEPAWCPTGYAASQLGWEPDPAYKRGRYWVEPSPDGRDFRLHASYGDLHYVLDDAGEPKRLE